MYVRVRQTFILAHAHVGTRSHVYACVTSVTVHRCGAECRVARLSAEIFIKHINGKSGCLF